MLRMTKQTDYGIVLLTRFAREATRETLTARDLATESHLPLPMVSKILKVLARDGLLLSLRGVKGGYRLARAPETITMAEVVTALEGPVSITECSASDSQCEHEGFCSVGGAWQRVNIAIRRALDDVSLSDLIRSNSPTPTFRFAGLPVTVETKTK